MFRQIIKNSLFLPRSSNSSSIPLVRYYSSLLPSKVRLGKTNGYKWIDKTILSSTLKTPHQIVRNSVTKFVGPMTRMRLQHADGIPPKYELIYRIDFALYLVALQGMSLLFLTVVTIGFIGDYFFGDDDETKVQKVEEPSMAQKLQKDLQDQLGTSSPVLRPKFEKEEILGENNSLLWVLLTTFVLLTTGVLRLQRRLPVRIYGSPQGNHRLAVYYSSLIPGKPRVREFVAGTVERAHKKKGILWTEAVYKDATGKQMLLLPQFFREPMDFHTLLKDPNDVFVEEPDDD